MDSFASLRDFTSNYVSLTDTEFNFLTSHIELRKFQKKDKLVREGEVEKYVNFIDSGLARLYFIRGREEIIMQFSMENEIICCYDSYFSGEPSNFSVEAIEQLVVFSITHENLEKLFEFSPRFERLGRLYTREEYLKKANYEYNRVRVNTKARFINFIRNNGNLLQRVPQKYIASYLNIKPETFSRMKHFTKGRL